MSAKPNPVRAWRRLGVCLLVVVPVAGCGNNDNNDGPTGVANPASVFCEEQGGHVANERDADGGERGVCVLPDGTRVDEWEYWRQHHPGQDED
jgi:uncharacterized protein